MKRTGLLLVLLLATAIRLFQLPERVVWFDEAVSLLVARATPVEIVAAAHDDTHPPGYNLVLHFLPKGELAARGFSVACGVLTVAVVFLIGRKLGGPTAGAVAAGLMAVCPLHVWYSQEIRMYALQTLLVTVSWWLLFLALERRWCWLGYVVVTALSLYTQYTSAFAVAAQWLYVLGGRRDALRSWVVAQAGVAALFVPAVPLLAQQYGGGTFGYWMKDFSWTDPVRFFALLSGAIPRNPWPYWPWVLLSFFVVWQGRKAVPLMLWLLTPVAMLAAQSLGGNVFLPRTLVFVTPAFALLAGGNRKIAAVVAVASLIGLGNYFYRPNPWIRSDLRSAAARVTAEYRPWDLVVHQSRFSYRPFQFYLDPAIPQVVEQETEAMPALFKVIGSRGLPANTSGVRRVWLVSFPDFQRPDAGTATVAWLREHQWPVIRLACGGSAP